MSKLARDHRNGDLARIHIAKQQLSMTEEDYLAMLWTQGRVRSAADLDFAGRRRVLDYLAAIGFKPTAGKSAKRPARPTPAPDKVKLVRRIRAQLISLDRKPDAYADGIAKQMFGVEFFEWCAHDQLHAITAALGVQQVKEGVPTR
jgi:phage gp16-like protein